MEGKPASALPQLCGCGLEMRAYRSLRQACPKGQARTPSSTLEPAWGGADPGLPLPCILKQGPQPLPEHPQQPFVALCPRQLSPSTGLSSLEDKWQEGPLMTRTRKEHEPCSQMDLAGNLAVPGPGRDLKQITSPL